MLRRNEYSNVNTMESVKRTASIHSGITNKEQSRLNRKLIPFIGGFCIIGLSIVFYIVLNVSNNNTIQSEKLISYSEINSKREANNFKSSMNNTVSQPNDMQWMVIAGSFRKKSNAENMVNKLYTLGFTDAEIVKLDKANYNRVVADYKENKTIAEDVATRLRSKGVECYVKART